MTGRRAHQWALALPVSANTLVCERCGHRKQIGATDSKPCMQSLLDHIAEALRTWR
jgi:hypothetical protein